MGQASTARLRYVQSPAIRMYATWADLRFDREGMSTEQCVNFLHVYPTPASFFEDLEYRQAIGMEGVNHDQEGRPVKRSRKVSASDPRHHVNSKVDAGWRPRPICDPTSARFWHLAMADDYAGSILPTS